MKQVKWILCTFLVIFSPVIAHTLSDAEKTFARHTAQDIGMPLKEVEKILSSTKMLPKVIKLIASPAEGLPWYRYERLLINKKRIAAGKAFMQRNKQALTRAENQFGVPASIITAIIGIETFYGERQGSFRAIDALSTLAFHYPPRQRFFQKELKALIKLAHEQKLPVKKLKGSYAGAMTPAQFMPSSYLNLAIDFNRNGKIDLFNDMDDAIGSIANYLAKNGWHKNEAIAYRLNGSLTSKASLSTKLKTDKTAYQLPQAGFKQPATLKDTTPIGLISLEGKKKQPQYFTTLHNFYVITTYNRSQLYAMAIAKLADKVAAKGHQPLIL